MYGLTTTAASTYESPIHPSVSRIGLRHDVGATNHATPAAIPANRAIVAKTSVEIPNSITSATVISTTKRRGFNHPSSRPTTSNVQIGSMNTRLRFTWPVMNCDIRYGENPNTNPPASDGANALRVRWLHNRYAVHAAVTGASSDTTLKAVTDQKNRVTGSSAKLGTGTTVAHARFRPIGVHRTRVKRGSSPCAAACGHHWNDHTNSPQSPGCTVRTRSLMCVRIRGPNSRRVSPR